MGFGARGFFGGGVAAVEGIFGLVALENRWMVRIRTEARGGIGRSVEPGFGGFASMGLVAHLSRGRRHFGV